MKKKTRNWIILALLGIGTITALTYRFYDSSASEELAEHYTKEWMKVLNVNEEVPFNTRLDEGEPKKLDSKYGTFLVKLKETKKYLDGYKITFSVANPSNITLPNPKVKIKWNRTIRTYDFQEISGMPQEYQADWNKRMQKEREDWSNSYKAKEFTNVGNLTKNSWTDLEFVILPCDSADIELVEFSIVG